MHLFVSCARKFKVYFCIREFIPFMYVQNFESVFLRDCAFFSNRRGRFIKFMQNTLSCYNCWNLANQFVSGLPEVLGTISNPSGCGGTVISAKINYQKLACSASIFFHLIEEPSPFLLLPLSQATRV